MKAALQSSCQLCQTHNGLIKQSSGENITKASKIKPHFCNKNQIQSKFILRIFWSQRIEPRPLLNQICSQNAKYFEKRRKKFSREASLMLTAVMGKELQYTFLAVHTRQHCRLNICSDIGWIVNSTNITTNIETAVLSSPHQAGTTCGAFSQRIRPRIIFL